MDGKAYWVSWKLGYRKIGYSKISRLIIIQCPIFFPIKIIVWLHPQLSDEPVHPNMFGHIPIIPLCI